MKKIISLFSLLLLLSAASSQANVFVRFAQRAKHQANRAVDRTLGKVSLATKIKVVNAMVNGTIGLAAFTTYKSYELYKAQERCVKNLKDQIDLAEMLSDDFKALEQSTGFETPEAVQPKESTPEQARERAIARMQKETANAGSVVPVRMKVVSVNGQKPYNKEEDPYLRLREKLNEGANIFLRATEKRPRENAKKTEDLSTLPSSNGDRLLVSRHTIDAESLSPERLLEVEELRKRLNAINEK